MKKSQLFIALFAVVGTLDLCAGKTFTNIDQNKQANIEKSRKHVAREYHASSTLPANQNLRSRSTENNVNTVASKTDKK